METQSETGCAQKIEAMLAKWGVEERPGVRHVRAITKGETIVAWACLINGGLLSDKVRLSIRDWVLLRSMAEKTVLPWMAIFGFDDGTVLWMKHPPSGGLRYPLAYPEDEAEPCLLIPKSEFKEFVA